MIDSLKDLLSRVLLKDLLIDLEDRSRAEALKAHEMIRDGSGLDKKRSRELEGQARFRMLEQGFEQVCTLHGGRLLDGGIIPQSDLKVFQPFMRFEVEGQGVILGMAAMPDRETIPGKNKSRLAGVTLNYNLTPRLDFDGTAAKVGDVFVLFLFARDRNKAGRLDEIAVGVIDAAYEAFLLYESLDTFLSGHGDVAPPALQPVPPSPAAPSVRLKKDAGPFVPPEAPQQDNDQKKGGR